MSKISVIVPVYNVARVLHYTLDSIISQTLTDIEIICVDDCSEDQCRDILNTYATKDSRIKLIFHEKNKGLLRARKSGVEASSGKYIMFVDGDDELSKEACEIAYSAIEKEQTDMLAFGTRVINCGKMSEKMVGNLVEQIEPTIKRIESENLLVTWWNEWFCHVNLWNKIYNSNICKSAYEVIEDGYFLDAEDWYAFIVICSFAKSYSAIEDKLYQYNWGLGITGGEKYTLKKYDGRLTEKYVVDALYRFADTQKNSKEIEEIVKKIEQQFLDKCINMWKNLLLPEYRSEGFRNLLDMWGAENVLCRIAEREWEPSIKLSELLLEVDYFKRMERKTCDCLKIAAYIPFDINCKVQQELERLSDNHIIFITDETLSEQKCADMLPNYKESKKEKYRQRFQKWKELITKYQIDVVITWGTDSNMMFWDMLAVKGHELRPAYVVCNREFCCTPYRMAGYDARKFMRIYEPCDGVIVSSECDERFISAFSEHVKYIPVPIEMHELVEHKKVINNPIILWNSEISPEKHPLDLIHAMTVILDKIPDAELHILEESHGNSKIKEQLIELIHRFDIAEHVHFDSEEEREALYKKANVYVCTSEIENAWNSIGEAMLWKLPMVSYDMPWLPLYRDGRGIQKVKQGRWDLLAKEIVLILNNKELAIHLGNIGYQSVLEHNSRDFKSEWQMFFETIFEVPKDSALMGDEQLLYRYLNNFQDLGKRRAVDLEKKKLDKEKKVNIEHSKNIKTLNTKIKDLNSQIKNLNSKEKELNLKVKELEGKISIIQNSTTFKIGKMIMFFPIKVKLLLKQVYAKTRNKQ